MQQPRLSVEDYRSAPVLGHVEVADVALDALLLALGEPRDSRWPQSNRPHCRHLLQADLVVGLARALRYVLDDYRQAVISDIDDDIPF